MADQQKFFSALYKAPPKGTDAFDTSVTRLVATGGDKTVVGDQALQSLMFNFLLRNSEKAVNNPQLAAAVAGIKQRSVDEFVKAFPNTNLDELIAAAKQAGFDVDTL